MCHAKLSTVDIHKQVTTMGTKLFLLSKKEVENNGQEIHIKTT